MYVTNNKLYKMLSFLKGYFYMYGGISIKRRKRNFV